MMKLIQYLICFVFWTSSFWTVFRTVPLLFLKLKQNLHFLKLDSDQTYFSKYFSHEDWNLRSRAIDLNTHSILTDTKKDVFFSYHQDLWNNMNQLRIEKISFISTFRDSQSPEFGGSQFVFWEATKKGKELQRTKWPVPPPWMLLSRSSRRCCWAQGMVRYERIPMASSGEVGRSHCDMGKTWVANYRFKTWVSGRLSKECQGLLAFFDGCIWAAWKIFEGPDEVKIVERTEKSGDLTSCFNSQVFAG